MLTPTIEPPPPNCGRRLIPSLVDEIAATDPKRVFAAIPRALDVEDEWQDITYPRLSIAVSRCARWMESVLGLGDDHKAILYMGPLDLRFPIILLAAIKTRHVAQFSSARNSMDAHVSLVESAKCKTILLPDNPPAATTQLIEKCNLKVIHTPSLETFLEENDDNALYPWNRDFDEVRNKPFVILHTSGSTGIPKPVFVTHGTFASNDMYQSITSLGGKPVVWDLMKDRRVFVAFPLFHAACLGMVMGFGVFYRVTCVLPAPVPLTVDIVDKAHRFGNVEGSLIPPSVITDIYKNPTAFENMLKNIKFLAYVGGSLSKEIGDVVAPRIKLFTLMGATETMFLPMEIVDEPEHWSQIPISRFFGHEYVPRRDGLSELVVKRNPEVDLFQGAFCTFPDLDEYGMSDLYTPHPDIPGYWSFAARADDIICFSNAEKLNPITIESVITAHPLVNGAVVGGHGEFQASLLVEPKVHPKTKAEEEAFIETLWPTVMDVNRQTVAHGRIMKNYIILTDPKRSLPRAGKDTIQRYAAHKIYGEDFKQLYARNAEEPASTMKTTDEAPAATGRESNAEPELVPKLLAALHELTEKVGSMAERIGSLERRAEKPVHVSHLTIGGADVRIEVFSDGVPAVPHLARATSASTDKENSPPTPVSKVPDLQDMLYRTIVENAVVYDLTTDANLFTCGLDSLQLQVVVSEVNKQLPITGRTNKTLAAKDFLKHPTIEQLACLIDGA